MYFRKAGLSRKSEMLTQFGRFARNGERPRGRLSAAGARLARRIRRSALPAAVLDDAARVLGTRRTPERGASRLREH